MKLLRQKFYFGYNIISNVCLHCTIKKGFNKSPPSPCWQRCFCDSLAYGLQACFTNSRQVSHQPTLPSGLLPVKTEAKTGQLLTHPQVDLHALQLLIDIRGDTCSSSSFPVIVNTPSIGTIPPHFHDTNEIVALQVCVHLQLLLFIPCGMCASIATFKLGPC